IRWRRGLSIGVLCVFFGIGCTQSDLDKGSGIPVSVDEEDPNQLPSLRLEDTGTAGSGDAGQGSGEDTGPVGIDEGPSEPDIIEEPPPVESCCENPGVCGPGLACDFNSCECLEAATGACIDIGDPCNPDVLEPAPFVCIGYGGEGQGICREACFGPPLVENPDNPWVDTCSEGICAALPGTDSYCVPPECDGYFGNTCGPDATCLPTVTGKALCVPDGTGEETEGCFYHNECAHDLLCVDNVCAGPNCSPFSNAALCEGVKDECTPMLVEGEPLDIGTCIIACDVFYPDQCPDASWYYPLLNIPDEGASTIDGNCTTVYGQGQDGDSCEDDPNLCGVGLTCVKTEPEKPAVCETLCDPNAIPPLNYGNCPAGLGCAPLLLPNELGEIVTPLDFGTCVEDCDPWGPIENTGCVDGAWCVPTEFNAEIGECNGLAGPLGKDEPCDGFAQETSCGAGHLCMGATIGSPLSGDCRLLCDPAAADGGPGDTCPGGDKCQELGFTGVDGAGFFVGVGICLL
ncbi:MAG: hypothetical protein VX938_00830, partial [Myxococcota bacterium]|nr:hypothetical protein [Myxococcota bacterium]